MEEINARRSGRTTRIANFVVDQLFETGECIVSDHYTFEQGGRGDSTCNRHLINLVEAIAHVQSNGEMAVDAKFVRVDTGHQVVYFTAIFNYKNE